MHAVAVYAFDICAQFCGGECKKKKKYPYLWPLEERQRKLLWKLIELGRWLYFLDTHLPPHC